MRFEPRLSIGAAPLEVETRWIERTHELAEVVAPVHWTTARMEAWLAWADGLPTDVGTIGDSLNLGSSSGNYPNATGISPFIANPTRTRFWNVAAFDATSPSLSLLFGNAGRNTLRTPGRQNWDASVARNFRILEGHSLAVPV